MKEQDQVRDFMSAVQQDCPKHPGFPSTRIQFLREELIQEELDELKTARSLEDAADAIGDLLYVVLGTAVAYGINIDPIFQEIHRSNMTKIPGGNLRGDGKWLKGEGFEAPVLQPILDEQLRG